MYTNALKNTVEDMRSVAKKSNDPYIKKMLNKMMVDMENNISSVTKEAEETPLFKDNVPKSEKTPKTLEEAADASKEKANNNIEILKEEMRTEAQIAAEKTTAEFVASKNDEWYSKINDSIASNDVKTTTELLKEKNVPEATTIASMIIKNNDIN
jgi:hypothetical protein